MHRAVQCQKSVQEKKRTGAMTLMKRREKTKSNLITVMILLVLCLALLPGCADSRSGNEAAAEQGNASEYSYTVFPLTRNDIDLHLDCVTGENAEKDKNILLVHGATYTTHEFDVDYEDYSLVRRLADEGFSVWRLDIAGYGQSEEVEDGFMPDTEYAAEDINAAVEMIVSETGDEEVDLLGWSWGTMTTGRFAGRYPEHLGKLVLYAPILTGIGETEIKEKFNHNTWEGAAEDFQRDKDGSIDETITDPQVVAAFCSSCWRYDGEHSPNAWRLDAFVSKDKEIIDLDKITVPTLLIYGSRDPYLNYEALDGALDRLPEGSEEKMIDGGAHAMMLEMPYHLEFQDKIVEFLE